MTMRIELLQRLAEIEMEKKQIQALLDTIPEEGPTPSANGWSGNIGHPSGGQASHAQAVARKRIEDEGVHALRDHPYFQDDVVFVADFPMEYRQTLTEAQKLDFERSLQKQTMFMGYFAYAGPQDIYASIDQGLPAPTIFNATDYYKDGMWVKPGTRYEEAFTLPPNTFKAETDADLGAYLNYIIDQVKKRGIVAAPKIPE